MDENQISAIIVDAAIEVHRTLGGPGLLEGVYTQSLSFELELRKLNIEREKIISLNYKGTDLQLPLRIDLLVEGLVIVECKSVRSLHPIYMAQTLTYLRIADKKLGLVVNFGERLVKNGIRRVVNGLDNPDRWTKSRIHAWSD